MPGKLSALSCWLLAGDSHLIADSPVLLLLVLPA